MNTVKKFLKSKCLFQKIDKRSTSKIAIQLDNEITKKLENEEIKPRFHPGILKTGTISLPDHIIKGIINSIGDHPVKSLITQGHKISTYFKARHPPAENSEIRKKLHEIDMELNDRYPPSDFTKMSEEEIIRYKQKRENNIQKILQQRVFAWKPMIYGEFESLCYAVGRGAKEYAILLKILKEINIRDENFKPRSYFDFGSGVGTGMWAASTLWKDTIFEYFNVDTSRDMNNLSDLILREGNENKESYLKNVFYRQFLPASETKYDLVISSFSLFELSSKSNRLEVLLNLWKKCNGYMIIVEEGTRCGFELVIEARDLILGLENEEDIGHVFSPCSHSYSCPIHSDPNYRIPCNFEIPYKQLPIGKNSENNKSLYSYVVLKKGRKNEETKDKNWPRLVKPTLVRTRHTICRMCTSDGKLQEIIFTAAKHGKLPYRCARYSRWGDRLPINLEGNFVKNSENSKEK